jgi:hypothetical protein
MTNTDNLERDIQLELLYSYLPNDIVLLEGLGVLSDGQFVLPLEVSTIEQSLLDVLEECMSPKLSEQQQQGVPDVEA